ncbi:alanine--tRNA ligase [archaeon]|jgi:alanyl-tRNA synthetase|nr:alanine--tRNA ligase [archaeon]
MDRKELISKYIEFFKSKDHAQIPNMSLIPENDPTVLFIIAGMQPIVPYLTGERHPQGKRLVNVQRCIRTVDIDGIGDTYHHTMFEMIGNWSLGDYFKKEAIEYTFEFLTKSLDIPMEKLAVTCFSGNENVAKDEEAAEIWKSLGMPGERIAFLSENWWGPAGETGPCGPNTEIFYWKPSSKAPEVFDPADEENWVEIGNDVLMAYHKDSSGKFTELEQKNIDFGGGVERTLAVLNGFEDNYLIDCWQPIIKKIEKISGKKYENNKKEMRIIADHIKAATFMIADGIVPGNAEQGYILRRLIRRAIRNLRKIDVPILEMDATVELAKVVMNIYDDYSILQNNKDKILHELKSEEDKFQKTLDKGLKEFQKMVDKDNQITDVEAFLLYQSYGFPIEMIKELADEKGIKVDEKGFENELKLHQDKSRTASAGKFKSGLADNTEATKKLHTATHLLNESLRIVLDKPDLHQKGSNITPERLRFDFNFDRKLTPEEIKDVEDMVNLKIQSNLVVSCETKPIDEARKEGAKGVFDDKYGHDVRVYTVGSIGEEFSKEICAGPHVENTSELGTFKIKKEGSSSSGVRRIKAILE